MKVCIENILPFNLQIVADGGQAFRWNKEDDGKYVGVVANHVIEIIQEHDKLRMDWNGNIDNIDFIMHYFDIKRDYKEIEAKMMKFEELAPMVEFCSGYRILHQDPWETTISFIISANNSINNIKRTIERICAAYGESIRYKDKVFYTFPSPEALASTSEEELRKTKCGYRAKYIIETAKKVAKGEVDLYSLAKLPTEEIRKELIKLPGVGNKVADCIILYSMGKFDAFPVDTWIKRVMEHLYFEGRETSLSQIQKFAKNRFGRIAGFVQQYLFYYTRTFWGNMKKV